MKTKVLMKNLREMSDKELRQRAWELRAELTKYRAYGEAAGLISIPPHPMYIRNLKKSIARIMTVLRERELERESKKT